MHIRIQRDVLFKAFFHSQSVIERRSTLLVLGHTLIQAKEGKIVLVSTDMDLSLSEVVQGEIVLEGSLCVPTLLVYEILRKLKPESYVEMVFDDKTGLVILSAGRSNFEIPSISADDFPRVLQEKDAFTSQFTMPAPVLKDMIETVRFAISNDEMRYALNGINFSYHQATNKFRAVATDRHRLASIDVTCPDGAQDLPSIIVGKKTIGEISKLLDEAVEPVSILVSENRIELTAKFENSTTTISSRLIDGSFPEYEAILNIQHNKKFVVDARVFAEAVDRVGTIINDKTRVIKLDITRNSLECSAIGGSSSAAKEEVDIDYEDSDPISFNFDVKYLLDVAQHISTSEMEVSMTNPDTAVSIRPVGIDSVYFALMPLAPQVSH